MMIMIMIRMMMMIGCFNVCIEILYRTSDLNIHKRKVQQIFVGTIFHFPIHAFSPRGIFGYLYYRSVVMAEIGFTLSYNSNLLCF